MLQAALKVIGKKHEGKLIPLTVGKFLIGREHDCHLRPNSELVSRHHCVFTADSFTIRLRDLGSTNGTFVNNKRIRGEVTLKPGDRVQVGRLLFETIVNDGSATAGKSGVGSSPTGASASETTRSNSSETMYEIPASNVPLDPSEIPPEPAVGDSGTFVLSPQIEAAAEEQMVSQNDGDSIEDAASDTQVASHTSIVLNPTEEHLVAPTDATPLPANVQQVPVNYATGQDPYQQQYPGQHPGYMHPQMMPGYPPQMPYQQYPGYPYPQQVMNGYPPQPMPYLAPGGGYPQQQAVYHPPALDDSTDGSKEAASAAPPVRLPNPLETGAKAPEPKPEKPEGETSNEASPSKLAAELIKQQRQRRPGT